MRPKHSLDRLLTLKASGVHDLMGSITAQPAEEKRGERWDIVTGLVSQLPTLSERNVHGQPSLGTDLEDC